MTTIPGFRPLASGKVRDLYVPEDDDGTLLLVASDRVSAFDVVLEPGIPGKGAVLTSLTRRWFALLPEVPNHLAADESAVPEDLRDRAMLVRRLSMHPVECVVRGVITGSGYAEYRERGSISGVPLPAGLQDGDLLPEPIFTPAYKAEQGEHDENIAFDRVVELVGGDTAEALRSRSLEVYARARQLAAERGLILADTKLEFGDDPATGELVLADEVLTPDSSRYWDAEAYAAGNRGVSFDKQIVRDWLKAHWDGSGAPPALPADVVERTAGRYRELQDLLGA
ncbi:phosphoribosylaminoimidazolesuccinocarboxamide synthase [Amnibacterium sp. CER49]|uniref:phosphoribosylaminoimidazolesuccinocarboxamide synthase n=1 Tax=Amnibacterium sp. CER49 TaxID=3039161 RepID=UPI0024479BA3|nr:phosphoribosylaminoimidazolesuccinocarboxamide synthase [Amnibacterium sp. CER49]MDH2443731.1 phosphoribosylaminoimidazolesuccinocarboxamide synthase [Amnibacterium sp. CER49]